jgi:hypothetical protein
MREYLERHLEPQSIPKELREGGSGKQWEASFPESVRRDLDPGLKFAESGTVTLELKEGATLTFSYEPVPPKVIEEYKKYWNSTSDLDMSIVNQFEDANWGPVVDMERGKFRKLTDLSIRTSSGVQLGLSGLPVRHILFAPGKTLDRSAATITGEDVLLYGTPTTFLGLLILFHEIGHCERIADMTKEEYSKFEAAKTRFERQRDNHPILALKNREEKFEEDSETVLRDERGAWAEALSKLRPLLPFFGVSREDVLKGVHEITLASYSDRIRERLSREPKLPKFLDSITAMLNGTNPSEKNNILKEAI